MIFPSLSYLNKIIPLFESTVSLCEHSIFQSTASDAQNINL